MVEYSAYPRPPALSFDARWTSLRWRVLPAVCTVALGLVGFSSGADVTMLENVSSHGFLAHLYYTLGLFIFGGMDLGVPSGEPVWGQAVLWVTYFVAPTITASAVIEAIVRAFGSAEMFGRRLNGHVVIVGCGRLTRSYLRKLRDSAPDTPVLVLGRPGEGAQLEELRARYNVYVLEGRATSRDVIRRLRLERAALVLVLGKQDLANFDAATRMLSMFPEVQSRLHVHVRDLVFARSIAGTDMPVLERVFNGDERAAQQLVENYLLEHFQRSTEKNGVVLAGFGQFGQTVLSELQRDAEGLFDRVVIVDTAARRHAADFREQVGFSDGYSLDAIDGDICYPEVWNSVSQHIDLKQGEPVIFIGSGDDQANIRVAVNMVRRFPNALVLARNEQQWSFAASLAQDTQIEIVNVVQLVGETMPGDWFRGG